MPPVDVPVAAQGSSRIAVRFLDLLVVAAALPIFIVVDAPIAGYVAAAGAWVAGRFAKAVLDRRRARAMLAGNRTSALGLTAAAMLGRLWLLAGAILVVGLAVDREAGLAAALLAACLITAYLLGEAVSQLLSG